jgi:predicted enzyme related to lactoylglutathione lyase
MAEDRSKNSETVQKVDGIVSHIELLCDDPDATASFYQNVFGWEISRYELDGKEYVGWRNPDGGVPGGFRKRKDGERCCIINYVKTFNMQDDLEKILNRGGKLLQDKYLIPEVGLIAWFKDPFGNILGLFEPN